MPEPKPSGELVSLRRRALATYFVAAALTSVAYIATFQNASIAAPHITGTAATGGLPSSAGVAGTAVAVLALSSLMAARGRRIGIVAGISVAVLGSVLTFVAILGASFVLLIAGTLLIGFGNAAIALSRYAAADLYPAAARAGAVGILVWGSTLGAVAGPNLVGPANSLAAGLDLPRFAGGFAMSVLFLLAAVAVATFGPRAPAELPADGADAVTEGGAPRTPVREMVGQLLSASAGRIAVAALVSGQLVMVLIMTMTPFHLDHAGHGDTTVGLVISAHTFGMFALSPLSGRLTQRFGAVAVIMAGFAVLTAAGLLAAAAPAAGGIVLMLPLFLLGYGWNMGFVAGSSLLASGASFVDRARLQGVIDAVTWGAAAIASAAAGFVVELSSFPTLALASAGLALILALGIAADGRVARSAEA